MKKRRPEVAEMHEQLAAIIERNIETLTRVHEKTAQARRLRDKIADVITSFSGNLNFVYLHAVWFGVWIAVQNPRCKRAKVRLSESSAVS